MRPFTRPLAFLVTALLLLASASAQNVYFGNLHSHTSYSDGSGTPDEAFTHARDVARLDFLAITEHNHAAAENGAKDRADGILIATQPDLYTGPRTDALMPSAARHTQNGTFVAIYGRSTRRSPAATTSMYSTCPT